MAQDKILISTNFPYLPIRVKVNQRKLMVEALIDTGFDGEFILPPRLITNGKLSMQFVDCKLADNSIVRVPTYMGLIKVGSKLLNRILIIIMGDEPIIGREIIKHFKVIFDHGRKVIVEA